MTLTPVTCTAPVNIAVIKYWGKVDQHNIIPTNSSLSLTLDSLFSTTFVTISSEPNDIFFLNKQPNPINKRMANVLELMRIERSKVCGLQNIPDDSSLPLEIVSSNNFPTAAGLASSASGFACLVFAVAEFYQLPLSIKELSKIARVGSGSACRSLYGGYVAWHQGTNHDDSYAVQVAPATHWPMNSIIFVVNDKEKETSSTSGMQQTVETSTLFPQRLNVVKKRMKAMEKAIQEKDFAAFAELTMRDSNQFHAVCLDTYPPIVYMNDTSHWIVKKVRELNEREGEIIAAYTFDAGPNAVLYVEPKNTTKVLQYFRGLLPGVDGLGEVADKGLEAVGLEQNSIKHVLVTNIGDGPRVVQ